MKHSECANPYLGRIVLCFNPSYVECVNDNLRIVHMLYANNESKRQDNHCSLFMT